MRMPFLHGVHPTLKQLCSEDAMDSMVLGISEALLTTAAGLCVAIPALIAYRYLRGRVDAIVVRMEKDVISFADSLERVREAGVTPVEAKA